MDDFKKQTRDMITSYDLVDCPVHYRSKFRRKLMNIIRRRARRKLKRDLDRVCEIVERFSAHEKLCKQQLSSNPEQLIVPKGEFKRVKE